MRGVGLWVIVTTLQPRTPANAANGHATNRVLVYLDNGSMTHSEGGRTTTIAVHRGDVRWHAASGPYISRIRARQEREPRNNSNRPADAIAVELK